MNSFRAAAAGGFAAAAYVALVAASSGLAVDWPAASLACLPCIEDKLAPHLAIPGALLAAMALMLASGIIAADSIGAPLNPDEPTSTDTSGNTP